MALDPRLARARPAGRPRLAVGIGGARRLVEWPPRAAALGDLEHARRTRAERRTLAACARDGIPRRRRFCARRRRRHLARRGLRIFRAVAPPARPDPAGAARDPFDCLGAALHSVVRHFRAIENHADRGRRVLSGLSRRHGRDHVGRPQDRGGRPRASACRVRPSSAASCCRRCCRLTSFRFVRGLALAGCSWSRRNCSVRRRALASS